ncbi:testis-expressed protein 44 [Notamacropus eugenii]|uniref:testis-expressed protein 44 n=1 Tax=Notamacropus eugenii TaxID=9315 RepID=UPI003B6739E0
MSSFSSQDAGAVPTENENPETAVSNKNDVIPLPSGKSEPVSEADQNLTQNDDNSSLIYLDAGEVLPLSKSQDLSEDDAHIPNSQLLLIFEREMLPELEAAQSNNSIVCPPVYNPVCQVAMAPQPLSPRPSTFLTGEDDSDNDSYMRSITSLVGGGEGPIRSLTDILVWTETAMGTATGLLNASHTSMTDILHGTGTALRSMTNLLSGARSVLTSGLLSGTGNVLRTMSQLIGDIERRTVEGIRFAFRFVAHHMSPHRNYTDCDNG